MLTPRAAVVAAAIVISFSSPGFAQNLLPNAEFDTNLDGWDTTTGTDWTAEDSDGSPTSGSLEIVVTEQKSTAITTCVEVTGGQSYELGADIKMDLEGAAQGKAGIVGRWEADAACNEELPDFPANIFLTTAPDWTVQHFTATAPADAKAVLFELRATKTSTGPGAVTAGFDDAILQSALAGGCADPAAPLGKVTAGDALFVLRASVGSTECLQCFCNVNGTGGTTASDALVTLKAAVGIAVTLNCPACS